MIPIAFKITNFSLKKVDGRLKLWPKYFNWTAIGMQESVEAVKVELMAVIDTVPKDLQFFLLGIMNCSYVCMYHNQNFCLRISESQQWVSR